MAKWCSNLKLYWLPGRTDLLLPLVSIVTPSIYLIQTFMRGFWPAAPGPYCTDQPSFLSEVHLEALMRGEVYVTNVQSYTEDYREELWCFGVDCSWEQLVTKEAKTWAPEDVQRWRWWRVCGVLERWCSFFWLAVTGDSPLTCEEAETTLKKKKKTKVIFRELSKSRKSFSRGVTLLG